MTGQAIARAGDELPAQPQPQQHHLCPYMDAELPPHKHAEHHALLEEFGPLLREFLEAERRRRERWELIRKSAVGSLASGAAMGALYALAWLGELVLEAFRHWVNTGARTP